MCCAVLDSEGRGRVLQFCDGDTTAGSASKPGPTPRIAMWWMVGGCWMDCE